MIFPLTYLPTYIATYLPHDDGLPIHLPTYLPTPGSPPMSRFFPAGSIQMWAMILTTLGLILITYVCM